MCSEIPGKPIAPSASCSAPSSSFFSPRSSTHLLALDYLSVKGRLDLGLSNYERHSNRIALDDKVGLSSTNASYDEKVSHGACSMRDPPGQVRDRATLQSSRSLSLPVDSWLNQTTLAL